MGFIFRHLALISCSTFDNRIPTLFSLRVSIFFDSQYSLRFTIKAFNRFLSMIIATRSLTELPSILDLPAMAAPSGTHHDFLNPSNHETLFRTVIIFCLVLSVLAVGIRMWTKTHVIRKVVFEDCASLKFSVLRLSWISWLIFPGICCLALVCFDHWKECQI